MVDPAPHPAPLASPRAQVLLPLGLVLALALAGQALPLAEVVAQVRALGADLGPVSGVLLLAALYASTELMLVPGSPVSLLAGAMLGPLHGGLAVWLGASTSAALGFLLSRAIGARRLEGFASRHPRMEAALSRLRVGGWRWVVALRLLPAIPYTAQNTLAGLSGIAFGPYMLASVLAMVPGVLLWAWAGHTGAELSLSGSQPIEVWEWAGLLLSGLLVLGLGALVHRRIKTAEARR